MDRHVSSILLYLLHSHLTVGSLCDVLIRFYFSTIFRVVIGLKGRFKLQQIPERCLHSPEYLFIYLFIYLGTVT